MYNFCLQLINPAANFMLSFKEEGAMKATREAVHAMRKAWFESQTDSMVTVKDDYGHQVDCMASNIASVLMQDNYLVNVRNNDQNIDVARANDAFFKRRADDIELMRLFPGNQMAGPMAGRA